MERLDQFNFHHTLAETRGQSLVYFTAPACGACQRLKWLFEHHAEKFSHFTLFEVDAQREMALTHEFNIFHLPALFLYNEGEFHAEIKAESMPDSILSAVELAMSQPAAEAP